MLGSLPTAGAPKDAAQPMRAGPVPLSNHAKPVRRPKTAQALAMRSRVILLAADGLSNTSIAQQLSVTLQAVTAEE